MASKAQTIIFARIAATLVLLSAQAGQSQDTAAPFRDATATALLTHALAAMGGTKLNSVAYIHAEGRHTIPNSSEASEAIAWDDDWSSGVLRSRREVTESSGHTMVRIMDATHDDAAAALADGRYASYQMAANSLAVPLHLPALVLSHLLRDNRYEISLRQDAQADKAGLFHVFTSLHTGDRREPLSDLDWFLPKQSWYPDHVLFRTPDLVRPGELLQATVRYSSYSTRAGVALPLVQTWVEPNGAEDQYSFSDISFPTSAPAVLH